jgi:FtsP/CotA-like multicopper oxidase with cupredoxin domain
MDANTLFTRLMTSKFPAIAHRFILLGLLGILTAIGIVTYQMRPAVGSLVIDNADMSALPGDLAKLQACDRPVEGSLARSPANLMIVNGQPAVQFSIRQVNENFTNPDGMPIARRCYVYNGPGGSATAPTIRIKPGDTLTLQVKNELPPGSAMMMPDMPPGNTTNLHYHGLNASPREPQDNSLTIAIQPGATYTYKLKIPTDAPPGMDWYHPHVHMLSQDQVLSGLSGALIVEGIGRAYPKVQTLPEQVFVLRDQEPIRNPDVTPDQSFKDISINYVPIVTNPVEVPSTIVMRDYQPQFWRVANTAADSYMNLQVRYGGAAQNLEVVARDGVTLGLDSGLLRPTPTLSQSILLPPGSRAEFIVPGPPPGMQGELLALQYNTGIDASTGDRNLQRTLAKLRTGSKVEPKNIATLESGVGIGTLSRTRFTNLTTGNVIRPKRTFYFSQCINAGDVDTRLNPTQLKYFPTCKDSTEPEFYITEEGKTPRLYSPSDPDSVVVNKGAIEDWRVVNLDAEAHAFHIHQLHFLVLDGTSAGTAVGTLRDTVNIPGWDGAGTPTFVNMRMDFRGDIAGTFLYHCHILEHEDKGMMAKIQVK